MTLVTEKLSRNVIVSQQNFNLLVIDDCALFNLEMQENGIQEFDIVQTPEVQPEMQPVKL